MDREIAVVVPTEPSANEVLKAIKQLDAEGSIELYAAAVVSRQPSGRVTIHDTVGWGTALGAAVGALVGLLAGPEGVAEGALVGADVGKLVRHTYSGLSGDFVHRVRERMQAQPGGFSVCASVWEDWTVPIDTAVAPFGGVVFRQATTDVALAQMRSDVHAIRDERAHLEWEIARSSGDTKAKLEAHRSELAEKETALRQQLEKHAGELQKKWEEKIANIKGRRDEGKERYEHRMSKLSQFMATHKASLRELFT